MRNLTTKQLMFIAFYYFGIAFWGGCALYDFFGPGDVTGFSYGYVFAMFYFIARTGDAMEEIKGMYDDEELR